MSTTSKLKRKTTLMGSLVALPLALAGNAVFADSASAAFGVRFSTDAGFSAGATVTVMDETAGDDANPNPGMINVVNLSVPSGGADWLINFTGASSNRTTNPGNPILDISSFSAQSSTASTLYFEVSDTGFTPAVEAFLSQLSSAQLQGTLSATTYIGDGSDDFDQDTLLSTLSSISPTGGALSDVTSFPAGGSDPYALTISGTLVHTSASTSNFDASIQAVPEPLTLLGSGLALGFGGFLKRKMKQQA